jgi:phosphoribosylamine---glycine ligase
MRAMGVTCVSTPATELEADLFVIGPEVPLVEGLADDLRAQGKTVLGPGRRGAQLEGSKAFMKEFLAAAGVPTAGFQVIRDVESAEAFLATLQPPYVIKTDGLAAGKGVLVTDDVELALADVREKLSGAAFGSAGTTVIIEEGLVGEECSLMVLCDGERAVPLVAAQDFKRVGAGDTGANTGGMGAYAPMPHVSADEVDEILTTIVQPSVDELRRRGIDYRGVLYAGVMLTKAGPKLLEYNVRFGDPETEVLTPLYGENFFSMVFAAASGHLESAPTPRGAAVTVVLASRGYPATSSSGDVITGLSSDGQLADPVEGVTVFHAGTRHEGDHFVTAGGRVVMVTGQAPTLGLARERAYDGARRITFEGVVRRDDIAAQVV